MHPVAKGDRCDIVGPASRIQKCSFGHRASHMTCDMLLLLSRILHISDAVRDLSGIRCKCGDGEFDCCGRASSRQYRRLAQATAATAATPTSTSVATLYLGMGERGRSLDARMLPLVPGDSKCHSTSSQPVHGSVTVRLLLA